MKLSVAMCTYNGEKYIKNQLDSILDQTILVNEIVICDDCSTDNTIQIIEQYVKQNPNLIKLVKNDINLGSNKNFEKAILQCEGDYLFFSDQDDIWRRDKVEITLSVFKNNPTAEAVFSNGNLINDDGNIYTSKSLWDVMFFPENELPKPINLFDIIKRKGNIVTGATLCVKNIHIKNLIPFPNSKYILHDCWLAMNYSNQKKLFYTSENLIQYRIHSQQQIGASDVRNYENDKRIISQLLKISSPRNINDLKNLIKKHIYYNKQFRDLINYCDNKKHFNINAVLQSNEAEIESIRTILKDKYYYTYNYKILKKRMKQRKRWILKKYFRNLIPKYKINSL